TWQVARLNNLPPGTPVLGILKVTAHDQGCATGSDPSDNTFTIRDPIIAASAGSGGSISPSGNVTVIYGDSQKFSISASDKCHFIADVKVDGVSVGTPSSYTFTNVQTDHTIAATFGVLGPFKLQSEVKGGGGTITPDGSTVVAC